MEEMTKKQDLTKYENQYSEEGLMTKVARFAKRAGLNTTYYVLLLYNMLVSEEISFGDKAIIIGALGYFISPFDIIPDLMIGTGFLDDASVLLYALNTLVNSITPSVKVAAKEQLHKWFEFEDGELDSKYN